MNPLAFRLCQLPLYAKFTVSLFLGLLGISYLAATSLIVLSVGDGQPPTEEQIQDKYGGRIEVIPPTPPGEIPARPSTKLETKIAPRRTGPDGKTIKAASMWKYLTHTEADPDTKDSKRAEALHSILTAWIDIAWREAHGRQPVSPTAPAGKRPTTSAEIDASAALADAALLSFEQYHTRYTQVILRDHCLRCHGGELTDTEGNRDFRADPLADVRRAIDLPSVTLAATKADADQPTQRQVGGMSPAKMALHVHIHAMTMAMMGFAVAIMLLWTGYPTWVKALTMPWGLLGALLDVTSWVLMKLLPDAGFAKLTMAAGGLFGLMLGGQIALVMLSMWLAARPVEPPGSPLATDSSHGAK